MNTCQTSKPDGLLFEYGGHCVSRDYREQALCGDATQKLAAELRGGGALLVGAPKTPLPPQ